jgi:Zn-finger in ubiquitin-hydrolases and other protein
LRSSRTGVNPEIRPNGTGCVECLASGGWWLHLRRCTQCGHIGCCDSSPSRHATKHFDTTGHPIVASFEPGEAWFYDYSTGNMIRGRSWRRRDGIPTINRPLDPPGRFRSTGNRISAELTDRCQFFLCRDLKRCSSNIQRGSRGIAPALA